MTLEELEFYHSHQNDYLVGINQFECPICNKIFTIKGFKQHIRKEHYNKSNAIENSGGYNGHYSSAEYRQKISEVNGESNRTRANQAYGEYKWVEVECDGINCNNHFLVYEREKMVLKKHHYCSSKCAHTRIITDEQKQRISQTTSESLKRLAKYL